MGGGGALPGILNELIQQALVVCVTRAVQDSFLQVPLTFPEPLRQCTVPPSRRHTRTLVHSELPPAAN